MSIFKGSTRNRVQTAVTKIVKEILFHTPLRSAAFPHYGYNMTPPQLCFLCEQIERTREVPGAVLEVGCSTGATTVFLARYLEARGIQKEFICVDTFAGFVSDDIAHEVDHRGKRPGMFTGFRANSQRWFDATMARNGVGWVRSIRADVNDFDFGSLGPISFCLLDVDLYRPVRNSILQIFRQISVGGVLAVDDCELTVSRWDGAAEAFREFVAEEGLESNIAHGKIGWLEKA